MPTAQSGILRTFQLSIFLTTPLFYEQYHFMMMMMDDNWSQKAMATHLENVPSISMAVLCVWALYAECGVLVGDLHMSLCGIIYGIQGQWLGAGFQFSHLILFSSFLFGCFLLTAAIVPSSFLTLH